MTEENQIKKEYLESERWYKKRIRNIEDQIKTLRASEMMPGVGSGDGMPHGSNSRDLSDYVVSLDKLFTKLIRTKAEMNQRLADIHDAIDKLPPKHAAVLEQRYILNKPFHVIARTMNYSESSIYAIHGEALNLFEIPKK